MYDLDPDLLPQRQAKRAKVEEEVAELQIEYEEEKEFESETMQDTPSDNKSPVDPKFAAEILPSPENWPKLVLTDESMSKKRCCSEITGLFNERTETISDCSNLRHSMKNP